VVVVDLGGALSRVRPKDATNVLNEATFERNRRGKEQSVQHWAVKALANIGASGDNQERCSAIGDIETSECRCSRLGSHTPAQNHWFVSGLRQSGGELLEVLGPLGQHEAVSPATQGRDDVVHDLLGARRIGYEVAVDGGDATRYRRVGVARVPKRRGV
jgi:hypothetical protein